MAAVASGHRRDRFVALLALEKLRRGDYDAVITDLKMPGMSGVMLLERIMTLHPDTPIILMTGHGDRDVAVRALRRGAYAFIEKPIDRDFFAALVRRAIQFRQLSRQVERQRQHLLEEQERFHLLASLAPVAIFRMDPEGRCVYVSDRWCEIAGLTVQEALGEGWTRAVHGEDRDRVLESWKDAVRQQGRFQAEYLLERPDGQTIPVFGQAVAEVGPTGKVVGYIGIVTKRTERQVAQLLQAARDVIYTLAADGTITSLNPAFERHTGWSCAEWVGHHFAPLIHEEDLPLALSTFASALAGKAPRRFLLRIQAKDGSYRVGEFNEGPDQVGQKVVGVLGIGRDVSDRFWGTDIPHDA